MRCSLFGSLLSARCFRINVAMRVGAGAFIVVSYVLRIYAEWKEEIFIRNLK